MNDQMLLQWRLLLNAEKSAWAYLLELAEFLSSALYSFYRVFIAYPSFPNGLGISG